jgi:hypothetical protein
VYCRLCNRSNDDVRVFYKVATASEEAKCKVCDDHFVTYTLLLAMAILAAVALAGLTVMWIGRRLTPKTMARLQSILIRHTPWHKCKIIFVFYQIATRVPRVYEVALPPNIVALLETFSTIVTLGLDNVATAPLECMDLHGYLPNLLFWMTLPIVVSLFIFVVVALSSWWERVLCGELTRVRIFPRRVRSEAARETLQENIQNGRLLFHLQSPQEEERQANTLEQALRFVLLIMFVLYPKVTNVAFEGFPCGASGWDSNARHCCLFLAYSDLLALVIQSGLRPLVMLPSVAGSASTCPSSALPQSTTQLSDWHGLPSSFTRLACGSAALRFCDTRRPQSCLARRRPSLAQSL